MNMINSPLAALTNDGKIRSHGTEPPTQLALHATLGCAIASAGGNNCASGAAAGMIGELTAEYLDQNTNLTNQQIIEASKLTGAITSAMISGSDDGESVFSGSQVGRNAAENNALYLGGKVRVPFPSKDYDVHGGIQSNLIFREDSIGSDGIGKAFSVIPSIGVGSYLNIIPHGEEVRVSVSYGLKNVGSVEAIRTYQGNYGFGGTLGFSLYPVPLPVNITVDIPDKNIPKK